MAKKNKKKTQYTRVSLCTPTFNRRPFIEQMVDNILKQDYPKEFMEWIIVDDGTDPIGDLVKDIPFVKYIYSAERMALGKKRNFMHQHCTFKNDDDIVVYIDDDDYYPPERVSHSVETLNKSTAICAGSSEIYLWFNGINKMYKFGPYGPNHGTAGTFAFKRVMLKDTHYEDNAVLAEEKFFLKNYTIPFAQLNPLKTILVISHEQNTFDKRRLIDTNSPVCKDSTLVPGTFIKDNKTLKFYTKDIEERLKIYEAGSVTNKPDVLAEIKRRDEERSKQPQQQVILTQPDGTKRPLQLNEIIEVLKMKTNENNELKEKINTLEKKLSQIQELLNTT
jgi:glycosyltransferase involved in cell wall biosynthesis